MSSVEEKIKQMHEKSFNNLAFCNSWLNKIKKQFMEKEFPKDTKRIHDLTQEFEVWKVMAYLAKERYVELNDVLALLEDKAVVPKQKLHELLIKIEKGIKWDREMLRANELKSERRVSVLSARIETLEWVQKMVEELLKG